MVGTPDMCHMGARQWCACLVHCALYGTLYLHRVWYTHHGHTRPVPASVPSSIFGLWLGLRPGQRHPQTTLQGSKFPLFGCFTPYLDPSCSPFGPLYELSGEPPRYPPLCMYACKYLPPLTPYVCVLAKGGSKKVKLADFPAKRVKIPIDTGVSSHGFPPYGPDRFQGPGVQDLTGKSWKMDENRPFL